MTTHLAPLAATDLSAPSRHAALRAAMLANQAGCRLELVHVLEKSTLRDLRKLLGEKNSEVLEARIRMQASEALTAIAAELRQSHGVESGTHLVEGSVIEAIIAQAQTLSANLLIVGAHGTGFMRNWPLGATAERLLRKAPHPVLMVKQSPREMYQRVLISVDFSPCSAAAVQLAMTLNPNAQPILLHACEVPFEGKMIIAGVDESTIRRHREKIQHDALARIHQLAVDTRITHTNWLPVVTHGNPSQCILEQEEELGVDLIVLGKHGSGVTEELLLGSVTKHVLSRSKSDVLVSPSV